MTIQSTKKRIRALGMSVRYSDGEYRVNYPNGTEGSAYYTPDGHDAYLTALQMKQHRESKGYGLFGAKFKV